MRQIRASTIDELVKLCTEVELMPTANLKGITLLVDGEPVIIIGYDGWTAGSVIMHQWVANPRYVGRDIIREAFRYPFGIGNLECVLGTVRSDNQKALDLDRRLGFETVAVIPNGYGKGVDLHILHLSRDKCRWYRQ